jgi:hypothetical protein
LTVRPCSTLNYRRLRISNAVDPCCGRAYHPRLESWKILTRCFDRLRRVSRRLPPGRTTGSLERTILNCAGSASTGFVRLFALAVAGFRHVHGPVRRAHPTLPLFGRVASKPIAFSAPSTLR